ncbi:hypothetical protein Dsin_011189 [Dipteronia sinensis]|uniref:Uncharacterized protein n=1 Tax=Dipteronia sinensis TaxID=43782 RepID=A0AAE0AV36_9ROSI|nr:hypothetical protein Dsin_011189 [Dipteronia sinensis]
MNHNNQQSSNGRHDDDAALTEFLASLMDYTPTSLALQIVNVNGCGIRGIGFWTPEKRVPMKKLMTSSTSNNNNSASKPNLGHLFYGQGILFLYLKSPQIRRNFL